MIVAQTEPALVRVGQEIVITYLNRSKGRLERLGFPAEVVEAIEYVLKHGNVVKGLIVKKRREPRPVSLRMAFRLTPTPASRLRMYVSGQKVSITDISLRGASFSNPADLGLAAGDLVQVGLDIGNKSYNLQARILRTWNQDDARMPQDVVFASAEFLNLKGNAERHLVRKLHQIEREARLEQIVK
jgi:hypothetical protein